VDRRLSGKAYFEAMFGAKIRHFRQSAAIVLFLTCVAEDEMGAFLQPKQLQPGYVSSYLI